MNVARHPIAERLGGAALLLAVAATVSFPLWIPHHRNPIPTFYQEWWALALGALAVLAWCWRWRGGRIAIPALAWPPLALAALILAQWAGGLALPAAGEPPVGPDSQQHWEVLCIEDNPANLRLIERIVARRTDIRLLTAGDPGLGLELARAHRPDLILLDINLPDMDGYAVMRRLREDPATRGIPVVAISANAMPKDLERGKAAGFVDYLTKPLDVAQFTRSISDILRQEPL